MRITFRNASWAESSVTSNPNTSKMILDSPGKKKACMINRMAMVGRITLRIKFQYSRETFAISERGMMARRNNAGGVQYQGLRKAISTSDSAITTLVIGFSR